MSGSRLPQAVVVTIIQYGVDCGAAAVLAFDTVFVFYLYYLHLLIVSVLFFRTTAKVAGSITMLIIMFVVTVALAVIDSQECKSFPQSLRKCRSRRAIWSCLL